MLNLILSKGLTRLQGARFGRSAELAAEQERKMVLAGHSLARPRSAAARTSTSPEAAATYSVLRGGFRWPAKTHGQRAFVPTSPPARRTPTGGPTVLRASASTPTIAPASAPAAAAVVVAAAAPPERRSTADAQWVLGGPLLAAATSVLQHPAPLSMCDALADAARSVLHGWARRAHVLLLRHDGGGGVLAAPRGSAAVSAPADSGLAAAAAASTVAGVPFLACPVSSDPRAHAPSDAGLLLQPSDAVLAVPLVGAHGDRLGVLLTVGVGAPPRHLQEALRSLAVVCSLPLGHALAQLRRVQLLQAELHGDIGPLDHAPPPPPRPPAAAHALPRPELTGWSGADDEHPLPTSSPAAPPPAAPPAAPLPSLVQHGPCLRETPQTAAQPAVVGAQPPRAQPPPTPPQCQGAGPATRPPGTPG